MKDKYGNQLTTKEFFKKWGEGIQSITPFQQLKISLIGIFFILAGVLTGLITTFILKTWWLFIILIGSFIITSVSLLSSIQKYSALKKINKLVEGGLNEEV
jgi:ABC-type multidrug transport system permease subunit